MGSRQGGYPNATVPAASAATAGSALFEIRHSKVVVTGAGSGIGRAVALALASLGVSVYALGRRPSSLSETVTLAATMAGEIIPLPCDVLAENEVDEAFAHIDETGPATGLVHAAAQMVKMPAREMTPTDFREVVASTLFGSFTVLRRWALPLLDAGAKENGAAVMLSSNSASLGTPGVAHSSAGKAGVEALCKSLAREWGPHGVTINAVGPGPFPVEKSAEAWNEPSVAKRMHDAVALGRYGDLHEIVGPILFFLRPRRRT